MSTAYIVKLIVFTIFIIVGCLFTILIVNIKTKKLKKQFSKEYNEMIIVRYILEFGARYNEIGLSLKSSESRSVLEYIGKDVMQVYSKIEPDNMMTIISSLMLHADTKKSEHIDIGDNISQISESTQLFSELLERRRKILKMILCNSVGYYNAERIIKSEAAETKRMKKVVYNTTRPKLVMLTIILSVLQGIEVLFKVFDTSKSKSMERQVSYCKAAEQITSSNYNASIVSNLNCAI